VFTFQKVLNEGDDVPQDYMRLSTLGKVIVPKSWLHGILAKCKGHGASFIAKKLMDGFFEPDELAFKTASEMVHKNLCMECIKCKYILYFLR
jgi:hypothetical protein